MLFNSVSYALFLPVVFFLYWFVTGRNVRAQNVLLLVASYFFYACWDYRFLFLLIFSTLLDYYSGLRMEKAQTDRGRRVWFWLSVAVNLGFLGVFKYYNFFAESFADFLALFGLKASFVTLNLILPVGISFYTFHGLSYVIDIYNRKIKAEHNFIDYAVFVSFFPLLVAGPIERATHLLPQIKRDRTFNYTSATHGLRQILWGLFKKVVIADNCAVFANDIFTNYQSYSSATLVLGAVFFAFQIYGDFSGYSDIALGTARLFGIELLRNFAYPYFSRDIAEFWRRWHISLSSWFRDYVYIPLGGSKGSAWQNVRNVFVIFIISGFWHGANWTFLIWGFLNAIYILPHILLKTNRNNLEIVAQGQLLPTYREAGSILLTFVLSTFAWVFFRSESAGQAIEYISRIFTPSLFHWGFGAELLNSQISVYTISLLLVAFLVTEWLGRESNFALEKIDVMLSRPVRWALYYVLIFSLFLFQGKSQQFIYFQF